MNVEEFVELWARLQAMMRQAVDDGRIITVEAEDGSPCRGPGRGGCTACSFATNCGTPIVTETITGRATYACPRCEPEGTG